MLELRDTAGTRRPAPLRPDRNGLLHDLTRSAISASMALTCASLTGPALSNAQYACIDLAAHTTRQHLLDCLARDHGIDATMAEQLGALL